MALVIVWELPDGTLALTTPGDALPLLPGETEAQRLDRVAAETLARSPFLALAVRRPNVDRAALPSRRWRNAWRRVAGNIVPQPNAARALRRAEVLAERDARLERVRKKLQDAIEDNATTAVLNAIKQKARDLRMLDEAVLATRLATVAVADLEAWVPVEFAQT